MITSMLLSGPMGKLLGRHGARRSAIGIDVGTRSIKAVQLVRGAEGKPRVVAATVQPRAESLSLNLNHSSSSSSSSSSSATKPSSTGEAAAAVTEGPLTAEATAELATALATAGFTGRRAVLAAPAEAVMFAPLELPPRGGQVPLDQLARMEVARQFRCAPDTFELSWWELPSGIRGGRGTHGLAAALPHEQGNALLDPFANSRLDVEALDTGPTALVRACLPLVSATGNPSTVAILDLGDGPATLSFIHGGVMTFSRRIPEGAMGPLHSALCDVLGAEGDVVDYLLGEIGVNARPQAPQTGDDDDDEPLEMPDEGRRLVSGYVETLAKELALSLGYATHQYADATVEKLLLVGGGAGLAGLADRLASALGVPTMRVGPADLAECDPGVLALCTSPALTLALGLALREMQ